jgi:uncharacterized membrane protein YqiK
LLWGGGILTLVFVFFVSFFLRGVVQAEATAQCATIQASGVAEAEVIKARGVAEAERLRAEGSLKAAHALSGSEVAVELAKIDRSAAMLNGGEKYFFGQEPSMLSNIFMRKGI